MSGLEKTRTVDRRKLSAELKRRTVNPSPAAFVNPSLESVYAFRPELNATVETTPDGQQFVLIFHDGVLTRTKLTAKNAIVPATRKRA